MGCNPITNENGKVIGHICSPIILDRKYGPTVELRPWLNDDVVKTSCCHKITLATETMCHESFADYSGWMQSYYCKQDEGHCGGDRIDRWQRARYEDLVKI